MTTFALLSVSYFLYDYIAYLSFLYFRSVWLENTVFILLHELNIGWTVFLQKSFYPHLFNTCLEFFERFLNKFLLGLLFHGFLCFWNLFPEKTAESDLKVLSHEIGLSPWAESGVSVTIHPLTFTEASFFLLAGAYDIEMRIVTCRTL